MIYWLGQACGIGATVLSIIIPLFRHKWQMLINTALINLLVALNFILIGQVGSAAALCMAAVLQCGAALVHEHCDTQPTRGETVFFLILYLTCGLVGMVTAPGFVWEISGKNLLELLPIVGALLSMVFVFVRNEQKARWVLLGTCTVWAIYTAVVGATTFFAQAFSIVTTLTALWKYRGKEEVHGQSQER